MEIYTLDVYKTTESLVIKGFSANQNLLRHNLGFQNCIKDGKKIDPPYNTGNDFVYKDDYKDNLKNYLEITGQVDEEGNKTSTNSEAGGRYHTNWLNMMYPRLRLAKNLLTEDGVIFISIDDNEYSNLKKICDEIFGEENLETTFYTKVRHENRILRQDIRYQVVIEHLLCYRKSSNYIPARIAKEDNSENEYIYDIEILGEPNDILNIGGYKVEKYSKDNYKIIKKALGEGLLKKYQIRGSLISQSGSASEYYEKNLKSRRILDGEGTMYKVIGMGVKGDGLGYRYIMHPENVGSKNGFYFQGRPLASKSNIGLPYPNFYDFVVEYNNVGYEGEISFKNGKKPLSFLNKIFELSNINKVKDGIILDFFSGSSSTAHALMQLNSDDNGNRKFIMVQLPHLIDKGSTYFEEGFDNICEIGKERIRRAGDKIVEENKDKEGIEDLDIGFKVFKLDTSNIKPWNPSYEDIANRFDEMVDNFVPGRTEEDVVYEIMLKYGIDLTYPIEVREVSGKKVFSIGFGALIICLDNEITLDVVNGIVDLKNELAPETTRVVFKDNGFATDSVKTNAIEILKRNNINEVMSI